MQYLRSSLDLPFLLLSFISKYNLLLPRGQGNSVVLGVPQSMERKVTSDGDFHRERRLGLPGLNAQARVKPRGNGKEIEAIL
jgi:hypothetical protein